MFNVTKEQIGLSTTDKLLYDLLQEQKRTNELLTRLAGEKPVPQMRSEAKTYACKWCGKKFDNRYKMAHHSGRCPENPKNKGAK